MPGRKRGSRASDEDSTPAGQAVTLVQTVSDGVDGVDGIENTLDVCVSPDGKNVYAVGRDEDAVAVFTRNATNGTLSFLEAHFDTDAGVDGLDGPRAIAVTANGDFVYVGNGDDDLQGMTGWQRISIEGAATKPAEV